MRKSKYGSGRIDVIEKYFSCHGIFNFVLKKKYNLAPFKNSYQVEVLKIQLLANVVYENNFTIEYVKISLNLN